MNPIWPGFGFWNPNFENILCQKQRPVTVLGVECIYSEEWGFFLAWGFGDKMDIRNLADIHTTGFSLTLPEESVARWDPTHVTPRVK